MERVLDRPTDQNPALIYRRLEAYKALPFNTTIHSDGWFTPRTGNHATRSRPAEPRSVVNAARTTGRRTLTGS